MKTTARKRKPKSKRAKRPPSVRGEVTSNLSRPQQWLIDVLGGEKSDAGVNVNARTAMGVTAYFAGIRNMSEDLAKITRSVYERMPNGDRMEKRDDPRDRMLRLSPNDEMTSIVFHETMFSHAMGWSGGYAEIVTNAAGVPMSMHPLDPCTVERVRLAGRELRYRVKTPGIPDVFLRPDQVIDIHGLGYDGITGYAMTWIGKDAIGAAIAVRKNNASYFANGAKAGGILEVPTGFPEKAMENLRNSFRERYEGNPNAYKTVLLEDGVKFQQTTIDPQKSQMIESMDWHVVDIARLLRCPPHKLYNYMRAQGWSTIAGENLAYLHDSLMPWLIRLNQEYNRKLFLPRERQLFVDHDPDVLMWMDPEARAKAYTAWMDLGIINPNQIARRENLPNIGSDGDKYFMSNNRVPVSQIVDTPEPEPAPEPDARAHDRLHILAQSHVPLLQAAIQRVLDVEYDKASRAARKPEGEERDAAFAALEKKFYVDHAAHIVSAIAPLADAFVDAAMLILTGTGPNEAQKQEVFQFARAFAVTCVAESRRELRDDLLVEKWKDGARAASLADFQIRCMSQVVERMMGVNSNAEIG